MSFKSDIEKFASKVRADLYNIENDCVIDLMYELIHVPTPVGDPSLWKSASLRAWAKETGYIGGHFMANWQYGSPNKPIGILPDIDGTGNTTRRNLISGLMSSNKIGRVHYIVNNLPYGQDLEDGWSTQAPHGMVGVTAVNWNNIVFNVVKNLNIE